MAKINIVNGIVNGSTTKNDIISPVSSFFDSDEDIVLKNTIDEINRKIKVIFRGYTIIPQNVQELLELHTLGNIYLMEKKIEARDRLKYTQVWIEIKRAHRDLIENIL